MPNTFEYTDWLTMEGLRLLTNSLEIADHFNTDYNKEFTKEFPVGETVRIPLPQRFNIRTGLGYNAQNLDRIHTTVTVDQIFGVDFEWDSAEEALKLSRGREKISKEYLQPAMAQIKQEIDSRCASWAYKNTPNIVGVLGTNPTTLTPSAQARQRMVEQACPPQGRKALFIPPSVNTSLVPAFATYFQPADAIAKQYKEGTIGRAQNFDWSESMSLYTHTAGTWAGAVTISGAGQSGSSLTLTCTTGDTFLEGDVFSIANVLPVNPSTRRVSSTTAKQFVVTATTTGAGSAATVNISPAIVGPGSVYQNVNALPANGAALTLFPGTVSPNGLSGTQGLALHRDAFALVGVKLQNPTAVEMASQNRDPNSGISIAFVRMFDPVQRKMINRFDCMIGFGNLYPESCSVRYLSA